MINDILSQTVFDLDRYLNDPVWSNTYAGKLRDQIIGLRNEADAIRAALDRVPVQNANQETPTTEAWIAHMMSDETAFDLHTPRFNKKGLRSRGWSDALIDELLGPPDWIHQNPHFSTAAPMRCWRQDRVLSMEDTEVFRNHIRSASKRSRKCHPGG